LLQQDAITYSNQSKILFLINDKIQLTAYYNLVVARPSFEKKKRYFPCDWYVTKLLTEFAALFLKTEYMKFDSSVLANPSQNRLPKKPHTQIINTRLLRQETNGA